MQKLPLITYLSMFLSSTAFLSLSMSSDYICVTHFLPPSVIPFTFTVYVHKNNQATHKRLIFPSFCTTPCIVSTYTICGISCNITHTPIASYTQKKKKKNRGKLQSAQKMLRFPWDSPVLILEDKLPQFEVTENQSVVVAMCHSRGYLIEEPGSFVLSQLLAGTDKRVHVAIASLEEHIGPRLPKQNLQDLVNVLVLAKGEVGRQ